MMDSYNHTTNYHMEKPYTGDGSTAQTTRDRVLIRWDVSAIPAGATVTAVSVDLFDTDTASTKAGLTSWAAELYRCHQAWVDTQVTWDVYKTGTGWGTAGCDNTTSDRASSASQSVTVSTTTDNAWRTFASTAALVADVQAWVDGTTNNGWNLRAPSAEAVSGAYAYTEWAGHQYSTDTAKRPLLTVTWTAPVTARPYYFANFLT